MRVNKRRYPLNAAADISNMKELADRSIRMFADCAAFQSMRTKTTFDTVTYREFGVQLCALSNALIERGLMGKRVALVGENSYEWVLSYFAVACIGAVIVPLDKELPAEQIAGLVKRAGCAALIHSKNYEDEAALAANELDGLLTVSMGSESKSAETLEALAARGQAIVDTGGDKYSDIKIDPEQMCAILYTSGTTGQSKGVMLSHKNIASDIVCAGELVLYREEDVFLSVLPINHSYEGVGGIFGPMTDGSCIAFCGELRHLADALKLFRPTVMCLVPLYVETFAKRIWENARKQGKDKKLKFGVALANILGAFGVDIRDKLLSEVRAFFGGRLKLIICGGAYMNPELVGAFADFGVKVVQGYGITECSPIISVNRNESYKADSVGWLMSCNEVKFDDDGQILVRGDNVMMGYLDDPEATADTFDGEWFKTGDIGHMDKNGFLYITGRCKNLIVLKNGKNIMPDEIEYMLKKSPLVAEAMVKETSGDEYGSEGIMAIIFPEPQVREEMETKTLCDAIQKDIDEMNEGLVYYKRIAQFVLRESEFPKTTTRKIQRFKVEA